MRKNHTNVKAFYAFFLLLFSAINLHAQVPLASSDVMLQGFRWQSQSETKWTQLNAQSAEISAYFDLVWLPPSARPEGNATGNMGYHPYQWSDQNSGWGTKAELKELISSLHDGGSKVLADIVINHRSGTSWTTFPVDNYGDGYTSYQFTKNHIARGDEAGSDDNGINGKTINGIKYDDLYGDNLSGNNYDYNYFFVNQDGKGWRTWGGYLAARDLDHENLYVRNAIKEYMKFLKNEIGYDGWRYDLVKGYAPKHTKDYNNAAGGYVSVGEYFEYSYDDLAAWVKNTDYTSMVFDFECKKAVTEWGGGNDYGKLAWSADGTYRPAGLMHHPSMRQYAVTFIDNHDTASPHDDPWEYGGDIQKANAFLLSSPGIPCIFWKHWNSSNKEAIKQMITARKAVGLHSNSDVKVTERNSYYQSIGIGTCGELICRIGGDINNVPAGFTKACSGNGWAYYTKITSQDCEVPIINDGDPIGTVTIKFKAPEDWSTVKIWAWNSIDVNDKYTGSQWPGNSMTLGADGYYSITINNITAANLSVVLNNGNITTDKQQTVDLTTKKDVCWKATTYITESSTKKYSVAVDAACGATQDEAITVKVKSPSTLGNDVYIYSWDGVDYPNATEYTGAWPGRKMIKDSEGFFTHTFDNSISEVYIIFTDGVNGASGEQTDDIQSVVKSTCYQISEDKHPHQLSQKMVYTANKIECSVTTGNEEPELDNSLTIYPNPVENVLSLYTEKTIAFVEILNISGNMLKVSSAQHTDVSELPAGMYFAKVTYTDESTESRKFIKQ